MGTSTHGKYKNLIIVLSPLMPIDSLVLRSVLTIGRIKDMDSLIFYSKSQTRLLGSQDDFAIKNHRRSFISEWQP